MAAKTLRWKGSTNITETEGSPKYKFTNGGTTVTRMYTGPMPVLISGRPLLGGFMVDTGNALLVEDIEIEALGAGKDGPGKMTVQLISIEPPDNRMTPFQPVYEIEWNMLERKLEQHPIYQSTGEKPLTDDDFDWIAVWESASTKVEKDKAYSSLSANGQNLVDKKKRGEDSYRLYYPVARKTSQVGIFPAVGACGTVQHPPDFPQLPDGYVWLTSADRGTRTGRFGKWERQQEWDGADDWDEDLYPSA